jgi:hypothetical protein
MRIYCLSETNGRFYYGIGNDLGWSDPVFKKRMQERGIDPKKDPEKAGRMWIDSIWHGRRLLKLAEI